MEEQNLPVRIFFSHSSRDSGIKRKLLDQIVDGLGDMDAQITCEFSGDEDRVFSGSDWEDHISHELKNTSFAIVLVSREFLSSSWCQKELEAAFKVSSAGRLRLLPVLLNHCHWERTPLARQQCLPRDLVPLQDQTDENKALSEVAKEIAEIFSTEVSKRRLTPRKGDLLEDDWLSAVVSAIQSGLPKKRVEPPFLLQREPLVVELTIDKEFEQFTDQDEAALVEQVREVLGLDYLPKVLSRSAGSTKVRLELTTEQTEQLLWLCRRGVLTSAGVTDAKLIGDAAANALMEEKLRAKDYDAFLCHNTQDKDDVRKIAFRLRRSGILPWFDEWELQPGISWQKSLEAQIHSIKSAAVFIGNDGIGPWQDMELDAFIREFVRRECPVIPVYLKCCTEQPSLPPFLGGMTTVDFRKPKPNPFHQLVWGITGVKPQVGFPR